jgi:hypothetical protein
MTHKSSVVINSVVVPAAAGSESEPAEVEATVVYRPPHNATPQDCGKMVARIMKRMSGLADTTDD